MNNEHQGQHYDKGGIQTIEFLRAKLTIEELRGFYKANIIKYLSRDKGSDESDAKKVAVYAKWLSDSYGELDDH